MAFKQYEEYIPKEYSREDAVNKSKELSLVPPVESDIDTEERPETEFNSMISNALREDKLQKKQLTLLSKKPILRQRLVHLWISGYYSTREIARILCVSSSSVLKWVRDPEVQEMIRQYQDEEKAVVDTSLRALRLKAVNTQSELLDSDNDVVKANVAKDILDRTGHKAEEKKQVNINVSYEERLKTLINGVTIQDVPYVIDNTEDTQIIQKELFNGD